MPKSPNCNREEMKDVCRQPFEIRRYHREKLRIQPVSIPEQAERLGSAKSLTKPEGYEHMNITVQTHLLRSRAHSELLENFSGHWSPRDNREQVRTLERTSSDSIARASRSSGKNCFVTLRKCRGKPPSKTTENGPGLSCEPGRMFQLLRRTNIRSAAQLPRPATVNNRERVQNSRWNQLAQHQLQNKLV